MNNKLRRAFRARLKQKQDVLQALPGVLGDFVGTVESGVSGMVYVRVGQAVESALCESVPHIYDLPVWVGYSPHQPGVLRVLSQRVMGPIDDGETVTNVAPHAASHEWFGEGVSGGTDVIKVRLQQFMPLRVFAHTGFTVAIWPGVVKTASAGYVLVADTNSYGAPIPKSVDLSTFRPTTTGNARLVLITLDTSGVVVVTPGTEVAIANIGLDDIPAAPSGTQYILAAVRLWDGQEAIIENRDGTDIIDLRWPLPHVHSLTDMGAITLNDLSDATISTPASGQVLTYNGTAWINGAVPAHKTQHENGGTDEISVAGLSGVLADKQDADKLQGRTLASTAPTDGQKLTWNNTASQWEPQTSSGVNITVRESDGSPTYDVSIVEFAGATVSQPSSGVVRVTITGGTGTAGMSDADIETVWGGCI